VLPGPGNTAVVGESITNERGSTMSSTIRTTIETAVANRIGRVPAGYQSAVDDVVEAVEALALSAAESLRESGRALGASEESIESALVSSGLVEPEPVVEETPAAGGDTEERLSKIESAIERLTALGERAERYLSRF
jgi:hypothetical protein